MSTSLRRLLCLAATLLAGCGTFHVLNAQDEDFTRCQMFTFGGTRADLAALVMPAPNRSDHPYRSCRFDEICTVDSVVLARLGLLVDLPFSMLMDTIDLLWTVPIDLELQYLRYNHLAKDTATGECAGREPGPRAAANARHFGPYAGSAEACVGLSGRWEAFVPTGGHYCVVLTSDGGKKCEDTADCQGFCVVAPGPRVPVAPGTRGPGACAAAFQQECFQYVLKGVAQPRICQSSAKPSIPQ